LTAEQRADERLLLGLRLREGLHPADTPPIDPLALEDAMTHGLISTACGRLQCTENGWFLLDEAVRRLR
jgi:coproporphyrinogen III oxidase-like Fe-S oxidoreductase